MITLLVDPARFAAADLDIEGDAYRHLFRARRLAVGERLRLVDGQGRARWGEVTRIGRHAATVAPGEPAAGNEPDRAVELLVATLRPERAAWLVEKATELGVAAIRFLHTDRAPRTVGPGALARLNRVAAAALEQCHRSRLPDLSGPHPFTDLLAGSSLVDRMVDRWWLEPTAAAKGLTRQPPSEHPADPGLSQAAVEALLVGPEGGWSPAEQRALTAAAWQPVSLGPRVLRIETAALAGAALLLLSPGSSSEAREGLEA